MADSNQSLSDLHSTSTKTWLHSRRRKKPKLKSLVIKVSLKSSKKRPESFQLTTRKNFNSSPSTTRMPSATNCQRRNSRNSKKEMQCFSQLAPTVTLATISKPHPELLCPKGNTLNFSMAYTTITSTGRKNSKIYKNKSYTKLEQRLSICQGQRSSLQTELRAKHLQRTMRSVRNSLRRIHL